MGSIYSSWYSTKYVAGAHSTNTKLKYTVPPALFRWHWLVPIVTVGYLTPMDLCWLQSEFGPLSIQWDSP